MLPVAACKASCSSSMQDNSRGIHCMQHNRFPKKLPSCLLSCLYSDALLPDATCRISAAASSPSCIGSQGQQQSTGVELSQQQTGDAQVRQPHPRIGCQRQQPVGVAQQQQAARGERAMRPAGLHAQKPRISITPTTESSGPAVANRQQAGSNERLMPEAGLCM